MSSYSTLSKSCPYDGCAYVSQDGSAAANEHNVSSHISNVHSQKTKVWFGATQVTIHRDLKTKRMECPCGVFSHVNASLVRRHASNSHKGSSGVHQSPQPAVLHANAKGSRAPSTSAKIIASAYAVHRDFNNRVVEEKPDAKMHVGHGEYCVAKGPMVVNDAYPLVAITPLGPPLSYMSTAKSRASSSKVTSKVAASTTRERPTSTIPGHTIQNSLLPNTLSKRAREEDTTGPPSKVRRVEAEQPKSASKLGTKITEPKRVYAPVYPIKFTDPAPRMPSSTERATTVLDRPSSSTSIKRTSGNLAPQPTPKVRRVDIVNTVPESSTKTIKPPRRIPGLGSARAILDSRRASLKKTTGQSANRSITNSTMKHRAPSPPPPPTLIFKTPDSRSSNGPVLKASLPKPRTAPEILCRSCGDRLRTIGENCGACHMSALRQRSDEEDRIRHKPTITASKPMASRPALASTAVTNAPYQDETKSARSSSVNEYIKPATIVPKPRKSRVTKQMREREFNSWFREWTDAYRVRKSRARAGALALGEEDINTDKTNYWRIQQIRKQGGTMYASAEAFFRALQECFDEHADTVRDLEDGDDLEVMRFFGAYSIVAQPRIGTLLRADKVQEKMREIGFKLDSEARGHVRFEYNGTDRALADEVYKYPCCCGGTIMFPPSRREHDSLRVPDVEIAGKCGGTIMLLVGEDKALEAYGITGQRIAVDIVH